MMLLEKNLEERDHSTVVYAMQQIDKKIQKDPKIKATVDDIIKSIL